MVNAGLGEANLNKFLAGSKKCPHSSMQQLLIPAIELDKKRYKSAIYQGKGMKNKSKIFSLIYHMPVPINISSSLLILWN